jgi:hypothetical protein
MARGVSSSHHFALTQYSRFLREQRKSAEQQAERLAQFQVRAEERARTAVEHSGKMLELLASIDSQIRSLRGERAPLCGRPPGAGG